MNKVISINIGGSIFQVEEDAFEKLSNYLNSLKKYFSNKPEGSEIITDIENRIAELLQQKLTAFKSAITMEDVSEIIQSMGSPSDFEAHEKEASEPEPATSKESSAKTSSSDESRSRIYRDPDGRIIGGVCSGLGYYFKIDPLWIRLAFILFLFLKGSPIFIYLILWIIIPEARSTAEKLNMKKEQINIDTIQKSVETEFNKVRDAVQNPNFQNRFTGMVRKLADLLKVLVMGVARLAGGILGSIFMFMAVVFFIGSVFALSGFVFIHNLNLFHNSFFTFFETPGDQWMAQIAAFFIMLSLGFLFVQLSRIFFQRKNSPTGNRALTITTISLLFIALFAGITAGMKTASYFSNAQSVSSSLPIDTTRRHYYIRSIPENTDFSSDDFRTDTLRFREIHLNIAYTDGAPQFTEYRKAYGESTEKARANSGAIIANAWVHDSIIELPSSFYLAKDAPYRHQELYYLLRLPAGSTITFDPLLDNDVRFEENGKYHHDEPENGGTYKFTTDGIRCENCHNSPVGNTINTAGYPYDYTGDAREANDIDVSSALKVRIVKGSTFMIKAKGIHARRDLIVSHNGDKVEIRQRNHWDLLWHENNRAEVIIVTPHVETIHLSGAVNAEVTGFEQDHLRFSCSGASYAKADISIQQLKAEVSGASEIQMNGYAREAEFDISGAAKIHAFGLSIENLAIQTSGAGKAEVSVSNTMDADASGASYIYFKGNPGKMNQHSEGMGKIQPVN